ncbi:unnamed protein product [Victoria cruziana]
MVDCIADGWRKLDKKRSWSVLVEFLTLTLSVVHQAIIDLKVENTSWSMQWIIVQGVFFNPLSALPWHKGCLSEQFMLHGVAASHLIWSS